MKDDLLLTLSFFSMQRSKLLSRTLEQNHELFRSFFEFEDDLNSLLLAFYKEEVFFINSHFESIDYFIENPSAIPLFHLTMKRLMSDFSNDISIDSTNSILIAKDIILEKIKLLDALLLVDLKAKKNIDVLKYQASKDNRLFEREFAKLRGV